VRRRTLAAVAAATGSAAVFFVVSAVGVVTGAVRAHGDTNLLGFSLFAHAAGFEGSYDSPSAQTHPEGQGVVPDAEVTFNYGPLGYALSSVAWPGTLVANAGNTVIIGGGSKVPSSLYPVLQQVQYPVRAEARSPSGPGDASFSVPGTTMTSHTDDNGAHATAGLQGIDVLPAGSMGSVTTSSNATITADQAQSQATSQVNNLVFGGGVLKIASIQSVASAVTDGNKATGSGTTTVTGMTIAGQPASIDENGIHFGQQGGPVNDVLNQMVNQALAKSGLTIFLAQPTQVVNGATATESAGDLVIAWSQQGNNFVFSFGGARAIANASPAFNFSTGTASAAPAPPAQPPSPPLASGGSLGGSPPASSGGGGVSTPIPSVTTPVRHRTPAPTGLPAVLAAAYFSRATAPGLFLLGLVAAVACATALRRLADRSLTHPPSICDGQGP
jgi:hypothetical protein